MFGAIAGRYDTLNHVLSLSLDASWRRRAAAEACPEPGLRVLDLCGGTGDLSIALLRSKNRPSVVACCDFARPMLARAAVKLERRGFSASSVTLEGDALRLPFADGAFDAVTVGFGVRNLADMRAGLLEMSRVLVPGGRLVILEFSRPSGPVLSRLYSFYLKQVVPRLGDGASGTTGPYRYLARTIADFPEPDLLAGVVRESGFSAVGWQPLSGGIVCLHTALK
jgi:demethylmenaquinone methyltransferase / 2-methoxy-6-polyprenyl-1,4-benzoquinol methylase